jgi:hypothetical protein
MRCPRAPARWPVDEFDRTLAVAALVGDGSFQFRARVLQESEGGIHAGLGAQRIANSQARNDKNADQQFLLGQKTRHCFLLKGHASPHLSPGPLYAA